jgi:hypothetical protein
MGVSTGRCAMEVGLDGIKASDVSFLPIMATYARELGVLEEINRLCGRKKGVNAGQVCLALILDTFIGRSPLFRLEESFRHLDVALLLGEGISISQLNDDAVGGCWIVCTRQGPTRSSVRWRFGR